MRCADFDASLARDRFERTIAQEPDFALAHVGLSMAWAVLGYDAQARSEAAAATQLARGLRREQQTWIDGLYREATRDWPKAIDAFSRLVKEYPDEPDYVVRLAEAQTSGRQARRRLGHHRCWSGKTRRRLPNDPRLLLAEASAAEALGDAKRQEQAARASIKEAQRRGARLLVARASIALGGALAKARQSGRCDRGQRDCAAAGRRSGRSSRRRTGIDSAGVLARRAGDLQRAEDELKTALEIARNIGNKRQTSQALNELANVYFDLGRFAPAADMYREAVQVSREVGDRNGEARALGNLASVEYERGDVVGALKLDKEALDIRRAIGDRQSIAFALTNMGETARDLGDLAGAQTMYDESRQISSDLNNKGELSYALSGLAAIAVRRDDLPRAQTLLEEAQRLRREIGDTDGEVQARAELAAVLVERGDRARALQLLTGIPTTAGADTVGLAAAVRARLALDEGRPSDARAVLMKVRGAGKPDQGLATGVLLDLGDARVLAAEGRLKDAIKAAEDVRTRMRGRQLHAFELDAMLALAELRKDRTAATQLSARARREGFLLIARQAQALSQPVSP